MNAEVRSIAEPLVAVRGLTVVHRVGDASVHALRGVDLEIQSGERHALVGESGSGKSTLALALVRLLPPGPACAVTGSIHFEGRDLFALDDRSLRAVRGARIGIVFQDHASALDPLMRVDEQVAEVWTAHEKIDPALARDRARAMLARVGLAEPRVQRAFPHELSGGMRQRVQIAMALALRPVLLILDEPTTALDTVTQAEVFTLIEDLRAQFGFAVLLITHDLALARAHSDRIARMERGCIVRRGPTTSILDLMRVQTERTRARAPARSDAVLAVRDLVVTIPRRATIGTAESPAVRVLDGVTFEIAPGECLAVVGNSGSGKSTLARALLRLREPDAGSIEYRTDSGAKLDLLALAPGELRRLRPDLGLVFQDPSASLDPRWTARAVLFEALAMRSVAQTDRERRALELCADLGLEARHLDRYPHELSGGERQRLCLARALATRPRLLVLDEALSSLDQEQRTRILALLERLRTESGMACLLVTHDLGSVETCADRVAVLARGRIVEIGTTARVFAEPVQPETRALLAARPE